jgi:hypothetical protein
LAAQPPDVTRSVNFTAMGQIVRVRGQTPDMA